MRIAVAAEGNNLESHIDHCFGKSRYFMIYDSEKAEVNFIENEVGYFTINAGKSVINSIAKNKIDLIIAQNFGAKTMKAAKKNKIEIQNIEDESMNMRQIITLIFNKS
jgi:predicted Fe-Mo cluster-binding NifX family protein